MPPVSASSPQLLVQPRQPPNIAGAASGASAVASVQPAVTVPAPGQSGAFAPIGLTLPRLPEAFRSGSGVGTALLSLNINDVNQRRDLAEAAGVKVAKTSFFRRLAGAVVVGLTAAALIGIGAATGGLALVAVGAVTAAVSLRMSADAHMAKLEWQNAKALQEGRSKPHDLPMGTDAVAHAVYRLCPNSWSTQTRTQVARWGAFVTDSAIAAATVLATGGVSAATLGVAGFAVAAAATNQLLQARLSQTPTANELLLNPENLPEREPGPNEFLTERGQRVSGELTQRLIDGLSQLGQLDQLLVDLPDGPQAQAIAAQRQALLERIESDADWLVARNDAIQAQAGDEVSGRTQGLIGAGVVTGVMGVNTGVRIGMGATGVPAFTCASNVLEVVLNLRELLARQRDGDRIQGIHSGYHEDLAVLSGQIRDLQWANIEEGQDDTDFVMVQV
jgi:hypothetical protein